MIASELGTNGPRLNVERKLRHCGLRKLITSFISKGLSRFLFSTVGRPKLLFHSVCTLRVVFFVLLFVITLYIFYAPLEHRQS